MKKNKFIMCLLSVSMLISAAVTPIASADNKQNDLTEQSSVSWTENLNRGLTAVPITGGVYLSWRLQADEDNRFGSSTENVSFDIYRDGEKIATESNTTNYIDTEGTIDSEYTVVKSGENIDSRNENTVVMSSGGYIDIPIVLPEAETITDSSGNSNTYSFSAADCSAGDVDGDGEYEIIVKFVSHELDVGNAGYSGTVRFNAYKLDGTRLWENDINLGRNVFSSAHTAQFLVYDFDGDGKAEMTVQTSLGSTDSTGQYVSKASADSTIKAFTDEQNEEADFREANNGRITTGEEFLTIFDGETGEAIDTINYPTKRVSVRSWGKNDGGNRSQRFLACIAYLDGQKPYAVYWRGYYDANGRTGVSAISFNGERLNVDYIFDTKSGQQGYTKGNEKYTDQGNHNMTVADVDNDGKDEFISGGLCFEVNDENKLMPKWCSYRQHGDALHIGDYDPTHDGLEYFSVHEHGATDGSNTVIDDNGNEKVLDFGMTVYDAATGEELYHRGYTKDTGRGMMANIGSGGYYQIGGSANITAMGDGVFIEKNIGIGTNFRVFWDGDLYDELLDGTNISAWNGRRIANIFTADGCVKINGTKSNPCLQADLFGDWREEVIYPTSDSSALRVYTTTIETNYKMKSLMYDKVYRMGVAAEQTCYNQPPHIGYYLSDDIFYGTLTDITLNTTDAKTEYYLGEKFDKTGLTVIGNYSDADDKELTDYSVLGYDPMKAGTQTITVKYLNFSKTYTVEVIDEKDITVQNTKDIYKVGEEFDKSALTVKLMYENNEEKPVNDYKISGFDSMKAGQQSVTITYTSAKKTYTKIITFNIANEFKVDETGSIISYSGNDSEIVIPYEAPIPSNRYQIKNINENVAELYIEDTVPDIYAASYEDNGALKNIKKFETAQTGDVQFDAGFAIDKVFIWKNMQPVNDIDNQTAVITAVNNGAMKDSSLQKVYIYNDSLIFDGDDIFPAGVTIACPENSTAHKYALAHNINVEFIKIGDSVTFDEDFYSLYANKNMLMQSDKAAALKDEFITYNTHGAANNAPWFKANTYGFKITEGNDGNYLSVNAGIYDDYNKFNQVYITLNEPKPVSEKQIISFDVMFPSNSGSPYIEIQNDKETVIDTISGLTANIWYRYELSFADGVYTRTIYNASGNEVSSDILKAATGDAIVTNIVFKQLFDFSSWGSDFVGIVNIDNLLIN